MVLRRDPAAVLKRRIDLGHFCGRYKRNDWLLLPSHHAAPDSVAGARKGRQDVGVGSAGREPDNGRPAAQEGDMDGFDALIAYAKRTEVDIR